MVFATWLRALNAVGTVAEAARLFRGTRGSSDVPTTVHEADVGGLETRLATVVVAALREAFDRDRARFDLLTGSEPAMAASHPRRRRTSDSTGAHNAAGRDASAAECNRNCEPGH